MATAFLWLAQKPPAVARAAGVVRLNGGISTTKTCYAGQDTVNTNCISANSFRCPKVYEVYVSRRREAQGTRCYAMRVSNNGWKRLNGSIA
eukprot:scaffold126600_cov60-Phaeocystis_antarctica.AAC.2